MPGNLISLAEDLKQYPDQWLMHEVQNPSGAMPPYLILSELQRRKLLRGGSAAAPPASSVAQDTVRDTLQQITPPPPQGPPPPPGMASPARNPPPQGGPMPGAQPPANMPRAMQEGGLYDEEEDDPTQPTSIQEMINRSARRNRLDPRFMQSVAGAESNYDPKAVSPKGAIGPMQLMPSTAASMGVDPTVPQQNVDAGAKILRRLMDKYNGNLDLVLAAYNAGEGAVAKYGGVPPYPETKGYIRTIKARMQQPIPGTEKLGLPGVPTMRAAVNPVSKIWRNSTKLARSGPAAPMQASAIQPEPDEDQPQMTAADAGQPPSFSEDPLGTDQPQMTAADFGAPVPSFGGLADLAPPAPWQAPIPQTLLDARAEEVAASQRLHDLIAGRKSPFDPESIARNKAAMEAAGIHRPDYSKEDEAVAEAMKAAKQGLHPSISQILLQMGMGLLASRSPHFGVALGEAGMSTMQGIEKRRAAARDDYVAALRAGIDLSSKKNSYDEKMAELNYAQAKADEKAFTDQQKEAEKEQAAAHKEKVKAETDFLKSQTPDSWEKVLLNPDAYPPQARIAAAALRDSLHPPKAAATTKVMSAPTQTLNAYARKYAAENGLTLDESDPNPLNQFPPEHIGPFMATLPKSEAAELAKTQKEATQIQASRKYHENYFEKEGKPINDKLGRIDNAIEALNRGDEMGDAAAAIELVPATAGGAGSGVRVTGKEIDTFTKNRALSEALTGKLHHWTKGTLFEPGQREHAKQMLQRLKNKYEAAQEAISSGGYRLANSDDWKKEHWAIHNQVRDELNAIGDHAVSLRDNKGKLRHFDNVGNLPHATGQSLADPANAHALDLFFEASGGDDEMTKALARHWGWQAP